MPANNFTSRFPRLGYIGIKQIFDSENINYKERIITQASTLKEEIEKLNVKKNEVTLAKLDIVAMYPSIQFVIVQKAVQFFSKDSSKRDKEKINTCLELIGIGMKHTLVSFIDKYYEYG